VDCRTSIDLERINFNVGETENLNKVEELGDWSNN